MKRTIILALFALLLFIPCVNAKTKYVTANLNLRSAPSTQSRVLSVIPCGTTIEIDDCDCTWVPVYYNGKVGYVCSKYISDMQPVAKPQSAVTSYTNSYGNRIQSPTPYPSRPTGATALCRDGTYSFSQSRRGTCSHHGGVAKWF